MKELKDNPVTDMRGYGTHSQPVGTWLDKKLKENGELRENESKISY